MDAAAVLTGRDAGEVREGQTLLRLAEATITGEDIRGALTVALARLGPEATVDAVAVAAKYDGQSRNADATGCRLDSWYEPVGEAVGSFGV